VPNGGHSRGEYTTATHAPATMTAMTYSCTVRARVCHSSRSRDADVVLLTAIVQSAGRTCISPSAFDYDRRWEKKTQNGEDQQRLCPFEAGRGYNPPS
jgi:hypothetical protein